MNKCVDSHFGNMLLAYELGMLSDDERQEFEIHLLECLYCFERLRQFQPMDKLLRSDPEARDCIRQVDEQPSRELSSTAPDDSIQIETAREKSRRYSWLRPLAVAATLLLILILKPWNLRFEPEENVVASGPLLAVMPFGNIADESDSSKLASIATNLLATDLSESRHMRIVSSQAIRDLMERSNATDRGGIATEDISITVARAAQATWVLTGDIIQMEPDIVLSSRLVDVASGTTVVSHRVKTKQIDGIFTLVDELAARIRNDVLIPLGAEELYDPAVSKVTTGSAQAYRYYLEGIEYQRRLFLAEARQSWERALELDSTFAMCYYYLALYQTGELAGSLIAKAVEYSEQASRKEKLYILSQEAFINKDVDRAENFMADVVSLYPEDVDGWMRLAVIARSRGNNIDARTYFEEAIKVDSAHKEAYLYLTYTYQELGEAEQAFKMADAYIELAPGEPNPYDTKADLLARYGRLDEAIELYEKALLIKPDFGDYETLLKLGRLYKHRREYTKAGECFQEVATNGGPENRSSARTDMALIPLYQGKLQEAWQVLADGMGADRLDHASARGHGPGQKNHFVAGLTHLAIGQYDEAADEFATTIDIWRAVNPQDSLGYRALYAFALAGKGNDRAAESIIDGLKQQMEISERANDVYWIARGFVGFANGSYQSALSDLDQVPTDAIRATFSYRYWRARLCLENGKYADAVEEFSKALSDYGDSYRELMPLWDVQAHYYLAQAYELSGQTDEAIEQYETFINIWIKADQLLQPKVADARERLAVLRTKP